MKIRTNFYISILLILLVVLFSTFYHVSKEHHQTAQIKANKEALIKAFKDGDCTCKGHKLYGKIKFVNSFPDIKIKIVESFPDIKVKYVNSFPDDCGEWQVVESFPDLKVQIVESFPDLKVKIVNSFPGM